MLNTYVHIYCTLLHIIFINFCEILTIVDIRGKQFT